MPTYAQPASVTGKPAIIAPVSRLLAVADVARAVAFYRDVLGLPLSDVPAGIAWYRKVLGFTVNYQQDLGVMDRDAVRVLLMPRTERHPAIGSACVYVEDADGLHAEFRARGVRLSGLPVSRPWGLREFTVYHPEGSAPAWIRTGWNPVLRNRLSCYSMRAPQSPAFPTPLATPPWMSCCEPTVRRSHPRPA